MQSIHEQLKNLTSRSQDPGAIANWAKDFGSPEFKEPPAEEPLPLRPFDAFMQKLEVNVSASEKTIGELIDAVHNLEASTDVTPAEAHELHALYASIGMALTAIATLNNITLECKESARRENAKAYARDPRILSLGNEEAETTR